MQASLDTHHWPKWAHSCRNWACWIAPWTAVRRSPTARVSTAVLSAIVAEGGQGRPDRSASLKGALGATETKSGCLGWTLGDTSSGTGRPTEPQHRQSDNEPVTELRRGLDDKEWFVGCTQTTAEFEQCCTAQDVGGKVAFATPELCGRHYCLHQSRIFSSVHPQHQPHRPTPHSCPIAMVRATAKCQDASLGAKLQSGLPQLVPPFLPLAVPESSCPQAQGPARPSSTRGGNLPNEVLHQTLNVCPLTGAVSKTAGKLGGTLQATSSRQWCINQKFLRWPEEPATSPSTHQRGRSRSPSGCSSAAAAEGAASRCQRVKPRCPSWKRRRPSCHGKGPWRKDLLAHHRLTAAIQRDKARRPSLHGYCHADPIDQAWLCM
mmetsp:Transcript_35658/g.90707  ORF Transcript_35658/g.90707 Transcript_35658/m.90707 type:complete len:378 (-) Transcript_35658:76-1209(-)